MSVLSRKSLSFFFVVASLGLGGCAHDELALDDAYVPLSPEERFPIEYARGPITMEVSSAHGSLQPSQVNAVARFARQSMGGSLTPVSIKRPAGGGASGHRWPAWRCAWRSPPCCAASPRSRSFEIWATSNSDSST